MQCPTGTRFHFLFKFTFLGVFITKTLKSSLIFVNALIFDFIEPMSSKDNNSKSMKTFVIDLINLGVKFFRFKLRLSGTQSDSMGNQVQPDTLSIFVLVLCKQNFFLECLRYYSWTTSRGNREILFCIWFGALSR